MNTWITYICNRYIPKTHTCIYTHMYIPHMHIICMQVHTHIKQSKTIYILYNNIGNTWNKQDHLSPDYSEKTNFLLYIFCISFIHNNLMMRYCIYSKRYIMCKINTILLSKCNCNIMCVCVYIMCNIYITCIMLKTWQYSVRLLISFLNIFKIKINNLTYKMSLTFRYT